MNLFEVFGGRVAVFDGAMGTMLQDSLLDAGEMPEVLNFRSPGKILAVHRAYIAAGADVKVVSRDNLTVRVEPV